MAHIPRLRRELEARGVDVVDLGAGDSDGAPPPAAVEALAKAASDPSFSRYPFQLGHPPFREAVSAFMEERFGVMVDPMAEVLPLIGSKEGIAHLPMALLNPGDVAIIPDPGYQAYRGGVVLAGAEPVAVPLRPEDDFLLEPAGLPAEVIRRARLLVLNYPNNPTTATAPTEYLARMLDFCLEHGMVLAHDLAYSEIAFDGYRPPSILELPGAREHAVEFHSLSKSFNMTGWRLGWATGSRRILELLARLKTFVDTGAFLAVQEAGRAALEERHTWLPENVEVFRRRRDVAVEAFRRAGFDITAPRATMYLWVPVPAGITSEEFALRALEEAGVVVLPGSGLGAGGEGFFRVALTVDGHRLEEAAQRLARAGLT
ncbi:MAG: aminotransferase class I/II-fold pyridoxal phosphate-dependent enzyme [Gemmatimonadales bacterium]|nr:MAG: aminotransferase class I/II-fold pyridoxal phosphate-dependent enzyme [Gemmatimonadales bacterium]